jgi:ketosteroid isomerase-like protein
MEAKERLVRDFYGARGRRDWDAVRALLAEDVVWREADGEQDYSGDHHGRATVMELLAKLDEVTGGTFVLQPQETICTAEHVAATVHWHAERGGRRVEGNELAVYRIADGRIAGAWFFPDSHDPGALRQVFSFAASE